MSAGEARILDPSPSRRRLTQTHRWPGSGCSRSCRRRRHTQSELGWGAGPRQCLQQARATARPRLLRPQVREGAVQRRAPRAPPVPAQGSPRVRRRARPRRRPRGLHRVPWRAASKGQTASGAIPRDERRETSLGAAPPPSGAAARCHAGWRCTARQPHREASALSWDRRRRRLLRRPAPPGNAPTRAQAARRPAARRMVGPRRQGCVGAQEGTALAVTARGSGR